MIDFAATASLNGASHLNPLARDLKEGDDLSALVALRYDGGVQDAAAALIRRITEMYVLHGACRAIAAAVERVRANGEHPVPARVEPALQDMAGEAAVLAEHVAHAGRLEGRAAAHLARLRLPSEKLVAHRLRYIVEGWHTAEEDAGSLSCEAAELQTWLREPWRHPDDLPELSDYFADLRDFGAEIDGSAT